MGAAISNSNVEVRFTLRFEDTSSQGVGFYVRQRAATDTASVLQNTFGGVAIDSWSNYQSPAPITAHTFVDALELISLCAP